MTDGPQDPASELPIPADAARDDQTEAVQPERRDPAAIARDAMDRARLAARQRGATQSSPQRARRDRSSKRAASDQVSPTPYTDGREPLLMSESVNALLRRMGWTEQVEVAAVTARWREVIGERIAEHCEPIAFEGGVLTLRASSTAWATQLTLMSGQLRHRINEEFGREIVTELKVYGPISRSWTRGSRSVKGRGPRDTYG